MALPADPAILISYINTKLRDEFDSLDELCKTYSISRKDLEEKLASAGYFYDKSHNRFR